MPPQQRYERVWLRMVNGSNRRSLLQAKVLGSETNRAVPVPPLVIAHRGASVARPENTLEAFRHAAELGADWVELDVRLTADGALAVRHDPVLDDGRAVASVAAADLPAHVPLLDQALAACGEMGVNVEVKHEAGSAGPIAGLVVEAVRAWGGAVLVSSFDAATVDRVLALDPGMATGQVTLLPDRSPAEFAADCASRGVRAWNPHHATVDAAAVAAAHAAGLAVNPWTVDDPARIAELAAWGVDGIFTNCPDVARLILG